MKYYIKLMRMHHYLKNGLIFTALVCSGQFFKMDKLLTSITGFIAFCIISSVVYIVNDIQDREKDRCHPTKCNRPIAAGIVSIHKAWMLSMLLLLIAIFCNFWVFRIGSTLLLALYLILNLAYSFGLKKIPIVDVIILVAGFLIRVLYGAIITDIEVSNWLYLTVITFTLYFALGKRRNELKQITSGNTREVLKYYSIGFLDKNMYMCLTLANGFYALWSMDMTTIIHYHSKYLFLTVPIVLLITMKYSLDIERESHGDPVEVLIHDKVLIFLTLLYLVIMILILYFETFQSFLK